MTKNTTYDYEKSVSLFYQNNSHRGPGKVVQNLLKGLETIGVSVESIFSSRPTKYNGWLQDCHRGILQSYYKANVSRLLGPNLFVLPDENPDLCRLSNHFVVPTDWVRDFYMTYEEMAEKKIHVWPVGIDTDQWAPSVDNTDLDCFIYFKNRSEQDLAIVEAICRKFNLKYQVLKYGQYHESQLIDLCRRADFAVLLTGTESQGIAYMQILSTGTPCYVFNNPTWHSENGKKSWPASSVPYFDERCGLIANNVNLVHFEKFLTDLETFNPRQYMIDNHTLEKSAQEYYNLLRISNDEELVEFLDYLNKAI